MSETWSSAFASLSGLFAHAFVLRALLAGVAVSLCASLLGVVLVLKRYSMIGHGLADVGFASLSIALALGVSPFYVSTPVLVAASFVIMAVSQQRNVSGDLAIGVVSTSALSAGIIVTALTRGFNIDVYNYMFGSILAVEKADVIMGVTVSLAVTAVFVVFYNRLFLVTCDEDYARSLGLNLSLYHFLISLMTALTIVVGMRLMGTLLISSLIVFPAVTARKLATGFRALVILAGVISVSCFLVGMVASFALNLPTGACVVAVNVAAMLTAEIARRF